MHLYCVFVDALILNYNSVIFFNMKICSVLYPETKPWIPGCCSRHEAWLMRNDTRMSISCPRLSLNTALLNAQRVTITPITAAVLGGRRHNYNYNYPHYIVTAHN